MSIYGRIEEVSQDVMGSQLRGNHPLGATVLQLEDTLDFSDADEVPYQVQVRGIVERETNDYQVVDVSAVDFDTDRITISSPGLTVAQTEGVPIDIVPRSLSRIATIRVDDAEDDLESVTALVPFALYDMIPTGIRENFVSQEVVELTDSTGEYEIANVLGDEPQRDGTFIADATIEDAAIKNLSADKLTAGVITGLKIQTDDDTTHARIVLAEKGSGLADRIQIYGTDGVKASLRAEGGDFLIDLNLGAQAEVRGGDLLVGQTAKFNLAPQWNQGDLGNANPVIGQGATGNRALPGTAGTGTESRPATWLKVITPAGAVRWVPAYGP